MTDGDRCGISDFIGSDRNVPLSFRDVVDNMGTGIRDKGEGER
jgi:hypothetical protein